MLPARSKLLRRASIAAIALLAMAVALIALDPYRLVRLEFARQRIAAGLSSARIDVAGHRWAYAYNDDAPPDAPTIVMIHGFTGMKENWYPLAQRLRGDYRLLIPDLPGWGESERKAGEDYGFAAQSERVDAFIRAMARRGGSKASPRNAVILLGHSMGGGIAALTAARHPDDVARLGLLDAAGVRFQDNRFGKQVLAGKNPFAVTDDASLRRYLDTVYFDARFKPDVPWPAAVGVIQRRRRDAAFEQSVLDRIGRGPERFLPGEEAARIHQPVLLLWCRQDAVIDPSALGLYAARIPQAQRVMLEGCGHMSLMERPDAVAAAVRALIRTPTGTSTR